MRTLKTCCIAFFLTIGLVSCSISQTKLNTKNASAQKIENALKDTKWILKSFDAENRVFVLSEENKELTLGFSANSYGTNDGCNVMGGDFSIEDKKVTFHVGMATMRYCGDEMKHLIYAIPIGKTNHIVIKGKKLQLIDDKDQVIATYEKKDAR